MRSGGLCVSLTPRTIDEVFSTDVSGADCVEVRLDYLRQPQESAQARWDRFAVPVIVTCRGTERGGRFDGSIEEECRILEDAARNGARYVDVDYRFSRTFGQAEVIASYHNFEETPSDLTSIVEQACGGCAQISKVATQVNSWADNATLFDVLGRSWPKPVIVAGMGDIGQTTRILGPARGSFLTYAAATEQAAPGQIHLRDMLDIYKFRRVRSSTKLIGILGMPVGHSMSPVLHNAAFEAADLDFAYLKFPAPDLKDFFQNAERIGIQGFSVTIPHKLAVMPYMAALAPAAAEVGAVNTVSRTDAGWLGDNTDVHGVREALKSAGFNPAGKRIVILGKGGGARAAVAALAGAAEITVLSRGELADANRRSCDLLINATPVGMYPNVDASPISGPIAAEAVFDMVYNPAITNLLRSAALQGKSIIQGTTMLLAQAARQFEIWTGQPAPPEIFETELKWS